MQDLIKQILVADEKIRDMISKSEQEKKKILTDAHLIEENIIKDARENTTQKINEYEAQQKNIFDEKIALLEDENSKKMKIIDEVFGKNSTNWVNEIYNAIVSV